MNFEVVKDGMKIDSGGLFELYLGAFEDKIAFALGVSVIIVCNSIRYPSRQELIRYVADLSSPGACGMESRISVSFALFPHAYLLEDTSSRRIREWAPTAASVSPHNAVLVVNAFNAC